MQTSAQPQAAPAPPATPSPVAITTVGQDGKTLTLNIPRSQDEVDALVARREEVSDQLTSVTERRRDVAEEMSHTAIDAARLGLQDRLKLLDGRILQLETELATIGRQLSAAPGELVVGTREGTQPAGGAGYEEGVVVGSGSVLFLAVVAAYIARRRWKRPFLRRPALAEESSQRLERLEHGMDAIALEIERISEGQRFVTRLLSESQSVPSEERR